MKQFEVLKTKNNLNGSKLFIVIDHINKNYYKAWSGYTDCPSSVLGGGITVISQSEVKRREEQLYRYTRLDNYSELVNFK